MISIQCHRVGEWSAGKPEFEKVSIPVWGNHDYAGLNEVHIPFKANNEYNELWTHSFLFQPCSFVHRADNSVDPSYKPALW